jgi:hypothetical protein
MWMTLTDTKLRNAKATQSPYRFTDGHGLYALVNPKAQSYGAGSTDFKAERN